MSTWPQVEAALDQMLARRWYTNHGPMAQRLGAAAAASCGVRHAVVATNPTIALVMLIEAMELSRLVLVLPEAPALCAQAVRWAGLQPVSWPLDARSSLPSGVSGLLLSGQGDHVAATSWATRMGLAVLRHGDAGQLVPEVVQLGGCGETAGVGCVLTGDDVLAARLRNIRSSYGAGPAVPVARTANGRVSEAQAALALLTFEARGCGVRGG